MSNRVNPDLNSAFRDLGIDVENASSSFQTGTDTVVPAFLQTREVGKYQSLQVKNRDALYEPHDGVQYYQPDEEEESKDVGEEEFVGEDVDENGDLVAAVEDIAGIDVDLKEKIMFEAVQYKILEVEARNMRVSAVPVVPKEAVVVDEKDGKLSMNKIIALLSPYLNNTNYTAREAYILRQNVLVMSCLCFNRLDKHVYTMYTYLERVHTHQSRNLELTLSEIEIKCLKQVPCWLVASSWEDLYSMINQYKEELHMQHVVSFDIFKKYMATNIACSLPNIQTLPFCTAVLGEHVRSFQYIDTSVIPSEIQHPETSIKNTQALLQSIDWSKPDAMEQMQKYKQSMQEPPKPPTNTSYLESHIYKQQKGAFTMQELYKEQQQDCLFTAPGSGEDERHQLKGIPIKL